MKRQKNILALSLVLFVWMPHIAKCQSTNADSLLNAYVSTSDKDVRAHLAGAFLTMPLHKSDSLILLKVAGESDPYKLLALHGLRAGFYMHYGKSAEAVYIEKKALELLDPPVENIEVGLVNLNLGHLYQRINFYTYSSDHLQRAGEIFSNQDMGLSSIAFYEAALTSYQMKNFRKSISQQKQSLKYLKQVALTDELKFYLMSGWNTMGLSYQRLGLYDSALISFAVADSAARIKGKEKFWYEEFWIAMLQSFIGSVYVDMGKAEKALPYFRQDYEMMRLIDAKQALNVRLFNIRAHVQLKRIHEAVRLMNQINDNYAKGNADYWIVKAQVHEVSNDPRGALSSLYKLVALEDSMRREREAFNVSALKKIYDVAGLDENIRVLTSEKNKKQERIQIQVIAFSSSFLMLAAIAFAYYRYNKKSRNQLGIIQEQKEEMMQQNDMLHEALDKLNETQKQLIESAKMSSLGQMTAGLAHEINNPLNYISGGVQALNETITRLVFISAKAEKSRFDQIQSDIQGVLKNIHNGVGRASRIVQSLRAFSSNHSDLRELYVSEPVEMAIDILYGRIKDTGILLNRNYASNVPLITGNLSELNQVFSNLIDNAIHAMEKTKKKELTIETEVVNKFAVVKIRDTGSGIPEEIRDKIIEPFFTTREQGKGTGLGLSVSYSIIKKHKGELSFDSDHSGSWFKVMLPI